MKDSRKSVRVDAQLFISYDIMDTEGRVVQSGMALSEDLGRKGVKIREKNTLPVNTPIKIHLALGDEVLHVTGQVKHIEKIDEENYEIGVEFTEIGEEEVKQMKKMYPDIDKK